MNKYYINELKNECTYLELRIFSFLECEEKIKKITEILNFLNFHHFLINLTMLYHESMRAENMVEHQNTASLTIDLRDDKFRFKYWDGAKTYWTYHLQDLFNILIEGREEFIKLSNKYDPVTKVLFNFKDNHFDQINRITYKYYPSDVVEILYEIQFVDSIKEQHLEDGLLKEIYEVINDLELKNLKIDIDYTFRPKCIPCQKRRERENAQLN